MDTEKNPSETGFTLKRTLHLHELIPEIEGERILFPGGVICELVSYNRDEVTKRVEILSRESHTYGILKDLYVAYASHPTLLDVASKSGYVVEVRTLDWRRRYLAEKYRSDLLVIKRMEDDKSLHNKMLAPYRWMKKIGLNTGDKIIVSNPLRDYTLPAPNKQLWRSN